MNPTSYTSTLSKLLCLSIILLSITFPCFLCSGPGETRYANCKQTFECGDPGILGDLNYPFWGANRPFYCGEPGFMLVCISDTLFIANSTYNLQVMGANPQMKEITVAMIDFRHNLCPPLVFNTNNTDASILDNLKYLSESLVMGSGNSLLTLLYGCPSKLGHQLSWSGGYSCSANDSVSVHFVTHNAHVRLTQECASVVVLPILQESSEALDADPSALSNALDNGFKMSWLETTLFGDRCATCMGSGGQCGLDWSESQFTCYCPDSTGPLKCPPSIQGHKNNIPTTIGVSIGVVALIALLGGCFVFILQSCKPIPISQSIEDSLKNYGSIVPKRYTYRCIKKITKSFRETIGEGGYGSVFKGSLQDGPLVAVKLWKQLKGDGQDFVNEVMSISRTSHVNVVPLLGFCFEGHKRALIYEFMPNGSLEKFLHGKNFDKNSQMLSSQKLLDIAIGIGNGLEYLHRGMVHFDIKPHNILLDVEFIPKISDFGLAKPLKRKERIIAMSEARGTIGYIAPEVFCSTFGGVSHKSDVYSFGMMVLDMVGCKRRVNGHNVGNSSEAYFPQWIYKQLEQNASALVSERIIHEEDKELERKMILVGLWCIQTNPVCRPAMTRVVEMLEGKAELLEVPPIPILASPPRQQQQQETESEYVTFISSTIYGRT